MSYIKVGVISALLAVVVVSVYLVYFRHPPPDDILAANRKKTASSRLARQALRDDYDYDDDDPVAASKRMWESWIEENGHVSIGELYDKCEGDDRIMVGKTILVPDKKLGGVTSFTYVNVTWENLIDDGELFIEVKYNGKDLYSNHWELCTVDEGEEDQIIFCPIKPGQKNYRKQLKIPNYIPKGRYVTKAWATDQDGNEIGCAYSDFVL
ncbi:putative phosphatidylglycerol/phosphatidylinositol transfer protein 2 [Tubulanus polymorphus]|uniref:putative phosphatidylglycerol/phosphatidylinositol transfer protein 2 n=1 Tax=Tubulanus polymorphus TaxID=672921 RepID=UPI003DA3D5A0